MLTTSLLVYSGIGWYIYKTFFLRSKARMAEQIVANTQELDTTCTSLLQLLYAKQKIPTDYYLILQFLEEQLQRQSTIFGMRYGAQSDAVQAFHRQLLDKTMHVKMKIQENSNWHVNYDEVINRALDPAFYWQRIQDKVKQYFGVQYEAKQYLQKEADAELQKFYRRVLPPPIIYEQVEEETDAPEEETNAEEEENEEQEEEEQEEQNEEEEQAENEEESENAE